MQYPAITQMIGANHEIAFPPFLGCTDVDLTDVELVPAVGLVSAMIVIFSCFNLKSELKKLLGHNSTEKKHSNVYAVAFFSAEFKNLFIYNHSF